VSETKVRTRTSPPPLPSKRRAFVELDEKEHWIEVFFPYDPTIKEEVRSIAGSHFRDKSQGGLLWRVPKDLDNCDKLRNIFGAICSS
jgi:hypothetical protein